MFEMTIHPTANMKHTRDSSIDALLNPFWKQCDKNLLISTQLASHARITHCLILCSVFIIQNKHCAIITNSNKAILFTLSACYTTNICFFLYNKRYALTSSIWSCVFICSSIDVQLSCIFTSTFSRKNKYFAEKGQFQFFSL